MPRYVALEWDNAEARVAVARVRTGQVDLENLLAIPLAAGDAKSVNELGRKIADALKQVGVGGGDAIVAVGRANVELRFLSVPPVPPEELPDLVRFQAARQFSQPIEEGLIDYAPLASSGDPPTSVLAAVISPELLKTIWDLCELVRLTPKHLVLRPFAADSLVTHQLKADACVLTVDRLAEEVDLTVVLGEQAVFPRSVRVTNSGDSAEQAANVVAEMRRTIAAAQNQLAGNRVEGVYIFGREQEQHVLGEAVTRELSMPVEFVDPVSVAGVSATSVSNIPTGIGRFAPLIGALLDESRARRHEIDFLAPRKRPEPQDRTRLYALIGAAAATLLLVLLGSIYWQLSSLQSEIDDLTAESRQLDKTLTAAKPVVEHAKLLDEYVAGQVVWLDELKQLSTNLPPAEKVVVRELIGDVSNTGGARMIITGGAKTSTDISEMESKLRDERHRVSGSGGTEQAKEVQYPWTFRETVTLTLEEEARSAAPATKGSAQSKANASSGAGSSGKNANTPSGKSAGAKAKQSQQGPSGGGEAK